MTEKDMQNRYEITVNNCIKSKRFSSKLRSNTSTRIAALPMKYPEKMMGVCHKLHKNIDVIDKILLTISSAENLT